MTNEEREKREKLIRAYLRACTAANKAISKRDGMARELGLPGYR